MDDLLKALVREVRHREGGNPCAPISKALLANMELRVKGFLAVQLGICKPQAVFDGNSYAHELSRGSRCCHSYR